MKSVKHICLIATIVLFVIGVFLKSATAQTMMVMIACVFFEIWIHFVKHDRKRNRNGH